MKYRMIILIGFSLCVIALGGCSLNKYHGAFSGTLTSDIKRLGTDGSVLETIRDEEKGLLVMLKQDGDEVFVAITNSRLLGNCSLRAKINRKNGTAYIDNPQPCNNSISLTGSLTAAGDELNMSLGGFTQYSDLNLKFNGLLKK